MCSAPYFDAARAHVLLTIARLEGQLRDLDTAQAGETKSSAGDKFETSREMMQQQRDQLSAQLAVAKTHRVDLALAERADPGERVGLGSVVTLDNGRTALIAAGIGKLALKDGRVFYAISKESPVARELWGRAA